MLRIGNYYNSVDQFEKKFIEILEKLFINYHKKFSSERIGVFVSGGIDSSIIAYFTNKYFKDLTLFTLHSKKGVDLKFVKILNQKLKKKLIIVEFDDDKILRIKNFVKNILKDNKIQINSTQLSLAGAFYLLSQKAKEERVKIIFTGQGPDVLLAGYHRYHHLSLNKLNEKIKNDLSILEIDKKRDKAVASHFEIKLINPYLEKEFLDFSLILPPELKINLINDEVFEKYLSRKVGEKLGLPKEIIFRHKKALQYSTKLLIKSI